MDAAMGVEHVGIEQDLRLQLVKRADLGPAVQDRIWCRRLKSGAFRDTKTTPHTEITTPAITLFHISTVLVGIGTVNGTAPLVRSRYQVSIWGKWQGDVTEVANKVRCALRGFRGPVGGDGGPIVTELTVATERDLAPELDTGILQHPIDFYVTHHYRSVSAKSLISY